MELNHDILVQTTSLQTIDRITRVNSCEIVHIHVYHADTVGAKDARPGLASFASTFETIGISHELSDQ